MSTNEPQESSSPPSDSFERYFTVAEVADFLRVHRNTIYRAIEAKKLPYVQIGAQFRIPASHFIKYGLDDADAPDEPLAASGDVLDSLR